jgi:hypothetical protein
MGASNLASAYAPVAVSVIPTFLLMRGWVFEHGTDDEPSGDAQPVQPDVELPGVGRDPAGDYTDVDRVSLRSGLPALTTVLRIEGRWGVSNVGYADNRVRRYDKQAPDPATVYIDYGLSVLTKEALVRTDPTATDLAIVFHSLSEARLLAGYQATERFYEIGTPEALAETAAFLTAG